MHYKCVPEEEKGGAINRRHARHLLSHFRSSAGDNANEVTLLRNFEQNWMSWAAAEQIELLRFL